MGRNKSAAVSLSKLARRGDLSRLQDRNCNRSLFDMLNTL